MLQIKQKQEVIPLMKLLAVVIARMLLKIRLAPVIQQIALVIQQIALVIQQIVLVIQQILLQMILRPAIQPKIRLAIQQIQLVLLIQPQMILVP